MTGKLFTKHTHVFNVISRCTVTQVNNLFIAILLIARANKVVSFNLKKGGMTVQENSLSCYLSLEEFVQTGH